MSLSHSGALSRLSENRKATQGPNGFLHTGLSSLTGPTICGLLSSPDILVCHINDWRDAADTQANGTCPGVTYDQGSRRMALSLGGQEFLQGKPLLFATFRHIYKFLFSPVGALLTSEVQL